MQRPGTPTLGLCWQTHTHGPQATDSHGREARLLVQAAGVGAPAARRPGFVLLSLLSGARGRRGPAHRCLRPFKHCRGWRPRMGKALAAPAPLQRGAVDVIFLQNGCFFSLNLSIPINCREAGPPSPGSRCHLQNPSRGAISFLASTCPPPAFRCFLRSRHSRPGAGGSLCARVPTRQDERFLQTFRPMC